MESKLQRKIIKYLEGRKRKWYVIKIVTCNKPGHPDIEAYREGRVVFVECKDKGKKAAPLQEYRHEQLRGHGFNVFVIDDYEDFLKISKRYGLA